MTRIYLITPPRFDVAEMAAQLPAVLGAGDIACVQLRLKNASDAEWERAVGALMPLCWERDIAFIINDRTDIANTFSADGVHLGKNDMGYELARKLLGPDKIIGVSCYDSKDMAFDMAQAGADYVAFGAAFPTLTKEATTSAPLSLYEDWELVSTVPCVAIGGITPFNCAPLVKANVDFLGVISTVWDHPDGPVEGIIALQKAIEHNTPSP